MANKDTDIIFIIGGFLAAIAGIVGVNYLANKNTQSSMGEDKPKSGCNKCPYSK